MLLLRTLMDFFQFGDKVISTARNKWDKERYFASNV